MAHTADAASCISVAKSVLSSVTPLQLSADPELLNSLENYTHQVLSSLQTSHGSLDQSSAQDILDVITTLELSHRVSSETPSAQQAQSAVANEYVQQIAAALTGSLTLNEPAVTIQTADSAITVMLASPDALVGSSVSTPSASMSMSVVPTGGQELTSNSPISVRAADPLLKVMNRLLMKSALCYFHCQLHAGAFSFTDND